jgi:hypothetical protein
LADNARCVLIVPQSTMVGKTKEDKQSLHRLERGTYFYKESKKIASELNSEFNWILEIVPNIGHDYKEMSKAAADYLYKIDK